MTVLSPMVTPLRMVTFEPIQQCEPMATGAWEYPCSLMGRVGSAKRWLWSYMHTFSPKMVSSPMLIDSIACTRHPLLKNT